MNIRCSLLLLGALASVPAYAADFGDWVSDFRAKAQVAGISNEVLDDALTGLEVNEKVITLDGKQPERKASLEEYLTNTVTDLRVARAKKMLAEHRVLLRQTAKRYGVPPEYIVALWAIESDLGRNKGDFSVVRSLATLAYEGRRAEFFSNELLDALKILDAEGMKSAELTGSWAGAMGDCQFMPSTYLRYAVDADHDGARDIWNDEADIFASIANYLHDLGWNAKEGWGQAVITPDDFERSEADIAQGKPALAWAKRGLRDAVSERAPKGAGVRYAIYPRDDEDAVYLVTDNFKALLKWNRSRYFAIAVGTLADAIRER